MMEWVSCPRVASSKPGRQEKKQIKKKELRRVKTQKGKRMGDGNKVKRRNSDRRLRKGRYDILQRKIEVIT